MRVIFPSLVRRFFNNLQNRFAGDYQNIAKPEPKKEGEISIINIEKEKNNSRNTDEIEYVDYEDVK